MTRRKGAAAAARLRWAHKGTRAVPLFPLLQRASLPGRLGPCGSLLLAPANPAPRPPRPCGPPPPRWAPLTCGSARGRWALAGPGSGPGSGRAEALLACGRAPCPRGPGRVARRGCPCMGSPGGPWAPPGGASGLQTASRGAGLGRGVAGVKQKQAPAGQSRARLRAY